MTGSLKLGSLISLVAVTFAPFAIEGCHHLHARGAAGMAFASGVSGRAAAKIVLYDASVPIDFILSLRGANPDKRFVMLPRARAAIRSKLKRSEQIERRMRQVREGIAQQGLKYVIAFDSPDHSTADGSLLPALRWDPRFQLVGSYPLASPGETGLRKVYLYENTGVEESQGGSPVSPNETKLIWSARSERQLGYAEHDRNDSINKAKKLD